MLYGVNPSDGSLLLWSLENLDTFSPFSFECQRLDRRLVGEGLVADLGPSGLPAPVDGSPAVLQVQLSFTSRIPNALAPEDAATLALSDSLAVFHVGDTAGARATDELAGDAGSGAQKQLALLAAPSISLALLQADGCLGLWQMSFDRSANHFEDFIRTFFVTLPQGAAPLQASDFVQTTRLCGHTGSPIIDVLLVPSQPVLVSRAGPTGANAELIVWTIERERQFIASASKDAARQKELELVQLATLTLADHSPEFDQIVVLPALFNGNLVLFPSSREPLVPLGSGFVFIRVFMQQTRLLAELYFCLLNAGVYLDEVCAKRQHQSPSLLLPRPLSVQSGVSPAAVFFLHAAVLLDALPPTPIALHSPHVFAVHNALGSSAPLRPCDLRVVDLTSFAADIEHLPDSFLLVLLDASSARVRALTWHLQLTSAATTPPSASRLLVCKFQQVRCISLSNQIRTYLYLLHCTRTRYA